MTEQIANLLRMKNELKDIFLAGVNSVKPSVLIRSKIRVSGSNLFIENKNYPLGNNVYLIGFGKAVMGMAIEMVEVLGKKLTKGIISVPRGSINRHLKTINSCSFSGSTGVVSYRENCVNNQADDDTLNTTQEIMNLAISLGEKDTLIVLISGGGSALLSMPLPSMTLREKNNFWKKLQNCGADIKEVNMVRQKLSMVKAGKLAHLAHPATVLGFILSDIIEDPMDLIAGGPTCYIFRDPSEVAQILEKYDMMMADKSEKLLDSNETLDDNNFNNVHNFIIGNNSIAINAAQDEALKRGYNAIALFNDIQGLVQNVSQMYVKLIKLFCEVLDNSMTEEEFKDCVKNCESLKKHEGRVGTIFPFLKKINDENNSEGLMLIGGGEPSVVVTGTGKGGRNQELALQFSLDWSQEVKKNSKLKNFDVLLLSAGTDGQDGPTDAAGAFGYADISNNKKSKEYLMNNDAYHFYSNFEDGEGLLKTGLTGTNVMDIHLIYILRGKMDTRADRFG